MKQGRTSATGTDGRRREAPVRSRTASRRRVLLLHFDYYDVPTHQGIIEWVREHDWVVDASSVHNRDLPRLMAADGILASMVRPGTADWLRQFGCPIVRVHAAPLHLLDECRDFPAVECDYDSIGRLGAEHLLTLGRPHFAFYQRAHGIDSDAICRNFVATLRAAGHEPSVLDFVAENSAAEPMRTTTLEIRLAWLVEKLRALPKPVAIMTEDDRFAPDILEAAKLLGLKVPTQVAALGCDDNPLSLGVSPIPISSVDSNTRGVGYAAAKLVAHLADGGAPPDSTLRVPARRVVARESTATYAGGHQGVNAALQRLRQGFREAVSISSLARVAKMSVRGLQHAFRQELGRTVHDEMTRLRLAAATELLERTDLKLDAVAAETSLGDGKNLCRVFAKIYQISPDDWRRKNRRTL